MYLKSHFLGFIAVLICMNVKAQQVTVEKISDNQTEYTGLERKPELADVRSAKLVVTQTFGEAGKIRLPVYDIVEQLLQSAGIVVVKKNYDMLVYIDLEGQAEGKDYNVVSSGPTGNVIGSSFDYSGATLTGSIRFETVNGTKFDDRLYGTVAPPSYISSSYPKPKDAPFVKALHETLPSIYEFFYYHLGLAPVIYAMNKYSMYRPAAIEALGNIWHIQTYYLLISLLKDPDNNIRRAALNTLELKRMNDFRAVTPLISALKDEDSFVRQNAARLLGNSGDPEAVEPLIIALNDQDNDVRIETAEALGRIKDNRAVPALVISLKDPYLYVREASCRALGNIGDSQAIEPLSEAMRDSELNVSDAAAEALGKTKDKRAIEPLIHGMLYCRYDAKKALEEIDPEWEVSEYAKNAVQYFIDSLNSLDKYIRESAAYALDLLKDDRAFEPLILALRKRQGFDYIESILKTFNPQWYSTEAAERSVPFFIEGLKGQDRDACLASMWALNRIKDRRAIEPLVDLLKSEDNTIRESAAFTLEKITGRKYP